MKTKSKYLDGVTCPKCDREFASPQALSMHNYRAHTRQGRSGNDQRRSKHPRRQQIQQTKHTNNGVRFPLSDMVTRYSRASEIAAALAFLKQYGTVEWKEHQ